MHELKIPQQKFVLKMQGGGLMREGGGGGVFAGHYGTLTINLTSPCQTSSSFVYAYQAQQFLHLLVHNVVVLQPVTRTTI